MRLRRRPSPLLLLLIPALACAARLEKREDATPVQQVPRDVLTRDYTAISSRASLSPTVRPDRGTKDAPVDGLDGKPKSGPFVDYSRDRPKKAPAVVEDLSVSATASAAPKDGKSSKVQDSSVMDDRDLKEAEKGPTGTEGGVSEKDRHRLAQEKETGGKVEKVPDPPKEAPPLPQSEQGGTTDSEKGDTKKAEGSEKKKGAQGIEKPADLPDTPHDIPIPVPPSLPKDDALKTEPPKSIPGTSPPSLPEEDTGGVIQPFHSFILALTMILFSEVGDKTFLVAALMAMRHPRLVVFSAAFSALIAMTILSAMLGHAVPTLLPERFVHFLAAILFLVFGAKLMREGYAMSADEGVGEEMKEVEMELEEKEHLARRSSRRRSSISPYALEAGRGRRERSNSRLPAPARSPSSSTSRSPSPSGSSFKNALSGLNNLLSLLLSPAWVQTFVMTFLGEWGDRSQIATIAMAAGQDYWWVTGGAICGHAVCTAAAVIGGRAVAGRVSMKKVTLGGAFAFIIFGVIYLAEAAYSS